MNSPPRKRHHHAGRERTSIHVAHTQSYKKARILVTPQTAVNVTSSNSKTHTKDHVFQRHEVTVNPESEAIEEEEEEEEEEAMEPQMDEMQSQEMEEDSMPLVVFQCSTCRSIFGDSYAFVCSTEELWLVTLSHVTNVALGSEVQTANTGLDTGSSYYELLCHNCQAVLGRKYLTTPVVLDGIRDLFSFSTEAITSYTLGEPMQQVKDIADPTMLQAAAACHMDMIKLAVDRNEIIRLREEMEKVKVLMVTVDDRLAHLEGGELESEEDTTQQQGLMKGVKA